jgi:hypothetical protein
MAQSNLTTNQTLGVNSYLTSPNALFCAVMQGDGNFVVYTGSKPFEGVPVWATNTPLNPGKFFCIMQDDGNFVIYGGTEVKDHGPAIWSWTDTPPGSGEYFLALSDAGQLSVTSGTPSSPGTVLWSTPAISGILTANQTLTQGQYITSCNSQFFAVMQTDARLGVYNGSGPSDQGSAVWSSPLWASAKIPGPGNYYAIMQTDGNFVIYSGAPPTTADAVWATNTNGATTGQYWFLMGNDGYVYVITLDKPGVSYKILWTTNPKYWKEPSGGGGQSDFTLNVFDIFHMGFL